MLYAEHFYIKNINSEWEELLEIKIQDSITEIKEYSFFGFDNIISVYIPDNVIKIGKLAFSNCVLLKNIRLSNSLNYVGAGAFNNCENIITNEYLDGYYLGNESNKYVYLLSIKNKNIRSFTINDNTLIIGNDVFEESKLESITIPSKVLCIGAYAFHYCSDLRNVYLNDSLLYIDEGAFKRSRCLNDVIFPGTLTYIGDYAFYDCWSIKYVTIPKNVTYLGLYSFASGYIIKYVILGDVYVPSSAFLPHI